jgi:hypothetical protein
VRRRRLAALVVVVAIALTVLAAVILGRGSGDAFAGTWSVTGAGGRVVIAHVGGSDYTVVVVRSGDRLTVAAAPGAATGVIVLGPGPSSGTLEERFADGTSNVLTRSR